MKPVSPDLRLVCAIASLFGRVSLCSRGGGSAPPPPEPPGQDFGGGVLRRIEYSRCSVRTSNRSPTIAGDASAMSSSVFTCSSWNVSPAATTKVCPLRSERTPVVGPRRGGERGRRRIDPRLVGHVIGRPVAGCPEHRTAQTQTPLASTVAVRAPPAVPGARAGGELARSDARCRSRLRGRGRSP